MAGLTLIWVRVRADFRRRWRAWLMLGVVVGLVSGAVLVAAAGARRTDTSYQRFLKDQAAPDAFIYTPPADDQSFARIPIDVLRRLPQVADAAGGLNFAVVDQGDIGFTAPADDGIGGRMMRRKVLAGRLPHPDRADEVAISFTLAQSHHLGVGGHLRLRLMMAGPGGTPAPTQFDFRIVGIEAAPSEFPPQEGTAVDVVWGSPAFYRLHAAEPVTYGEVGMRLRHGLADLPALEAELRQIAGGKPVQVYALTDQSVNTERSFHFQAVALWLVTALMGLAGLLIVSQLLARQVFEQSDDFPTLYSLGMTRHQLVLIGVAEAGLVGIIGTVLGWLLALAGSPLLPIGVARTADPNPGFHADFVVFGVGALVTVAFSVIAAVWPAWRAARAAGGAEETAREVRPSLATLVARTTPSVTAAVGARMALEAGRGRRAIPVRTTIAGAAMGVAALVAALSFSASLDKLLATPALYGATWDATVNSLTSNGIADAIPSISADPRVTALSEGYAGAPVSIGSVRVDGMALREVTGSVLMPTPLKGRAPTGPDEVVLGSSTMAAAHAHIGSVIAISVGDGPVRDVHVVGTAVFPSLSENLTLGKGLAMTLDGIRSFLPQGGVAPPSDHLFVRLVHGHADVAELSARLQPLGHAFVDAPHPPSDLVNFGRVQYLPVMLGGLLAGLAVITLAHLLVTSIRRRRHDLAVLRTLGLLQPQVRRAVAWQATVTAILSLVVGFPVGLVAGRWAWILVAHRLGTVAVPQQPLVALAILVPAAIVTANLIALLPGRFAATVKPAVALRTE